jgi:hypothetical protein
MVLTSREVASWRCESRLVAVGAGDEVDWLRVDESHDAGTAVEGDDAEDVDGDADVLLSCGFAVWLPLARAWASHASRVLWSTGQAAAGSSWEDMVAKLQKGDVREAPRNGDGVSLSRKVGAQNATACDWMAGDNHCFLARGVHRLGGALLKDGWNYCACAIAV